MTRKMNFFGVHYICKLDKRIYDCITKDIVTENVIITDEQIRHIKGRHPNDLECFSEYFPEIILQPDYIIEANRCNTAVILKRIIAKDEKVQMILRLCTSDDPAGYMNSIITFMKIDDKRWCRYLRTKKILYKRK